MKKQNQIKEEDNKTFMFWVLLIAISFMIGFGVGALSIYHSALGLGFQNASSQNQTWIEIGKNQTLSNYTLIAEITNNVNLLYLESYQAIPIYYQNKLYQCTNITMVNK